LDYPGYFNYAGLDIDTTSQVLPGAYAGFSLREREDSVFVANVDYESPGWNKGIRRGQQVLKVNGEKATVSNFNKIMTGSKPGDKIALIIFINNVMTDIEIIFSKKTEKGFKITPSANPDTLQKQILEGWLKG
ncbi:MAG TPA: PDZ domain-containing protein, partial [Chitinophagaceae bacterium]